MVKERIESAVKPLLKEAKQAFNAEAGPMWSLICLMLRIEESSASRACFFGPDMTIEGIFHDLSFCRLGGGPIIPPSKKFMGIGLISGSDLKEKEDVRFRIEFGEASELMNEAIAFAEFGDIALRSMNVNEGVLWPLFVTEVDLHASTMRLALAIASRGGTMLSIMSVCATKSSSVGRSVTSALLIRSRVDELVSISHDP